jgi:O-antigen ligase
MDNNTIPRRPLRGAHITIRQHNSLIRNSITAGIGRPRFDITIEAMWLLGLAAVPLAFRGREWVAFFSQPKFVVLHGAALLIVVLWAFELALKQRHGHTRTDGSLFDAIDSWIANHPHRWAIVAVGGLGITFVASTLLSPLPWISLWGRDFGDQGYDLYSSMSYLVIFAAIALRVRTRGQILRVGMVIVAVSTVTSLYGISQHFGWDPIGRGEGLSRVISTFGNPIYFGAYLVMVGPVTLALGMAADRRGRTAILALASLLLAIQLASLWFTGARGPWVGTLFGLVSFVVLSWVWISGRTALRAFFASVAVALAALLIVSLPGAELQSGRGLESLNGIFTETVDAVRYLFEGDPAPDDPTPRPGAEARPPSTEDSDLATAQPPAPAKGAGDGGSVQPSSPDAVSRFAALAAAVDDFGPLNERRLAFGGRADIWSAAFELALSRDRVPADSSVVRGLRVLFGYGPDMFFYSYPLAALPQASLVGVSHTHNYGLQVLMEQGMVGVALLVVTAALVIIASLKVLRARRKDGDRRLSVLLVGVLAALIGRTVEQTVGVGRVSDLMLFWALTGMVIALAEIHHRSTAQKSSAPAPRRARHAERPRALARNARLAYLACAAIVGVVALLVFVERDVNPLRGGWIAANGFEQKAEGDADEALRSFQRAADLAPDVERYHVEVAGLFSRTAAQRDDLDKADALLRAAREQLLRYEERDRMAWQTQIELAAVTASLVSIGNAKLIPELAGRYRNVSALMPTFAPIQSMAAEQLVIAGEWDLGLAVADRAISLEAATLPDVRAWWARGEAAHQLGLTDEASLSFWTSIGRQAGRASGSKYAAASYRGLAFIAEEAGDQETAAEHHSKADRLGG